MGTPDNPGDMAWAVLGLSPGASGAQVRAAYLEKLRESPPDRHPEQFERVREAYDQLRDPRRCAEALLVGTDPDEPLVSLLEGFQPPRSFVGPQPWLALLKER